MIISYRIFKDRLNAFFIKLLPFRQNSSFSEKYDIDSPLATICQYITPNELIAFAFDEIPKRRKKVLGKYIAYDPRLQLQFGLILEMKSEGQSQNQIRTEFSNARTPGLTELKGMFTKCCKNLN